MTRDTLQGTKWISTHATKDTNNQKPGVSFKVQAQQLKSYAVKVRGRWGIGVKRWPKTKIRGSHNNNQQACEIAKLYSKNSKIETNYVTKLQSFTYIASDSLKTALRNEIPPEASTPSSSSSPSSRSSTEPRSKNCLPDDCLTIECRSP